MPTKTPKPGTEVDAWCTKCRLDLAHRIIAMTGDKIERVECRTCGGHHNYRAPKSAPAAGKTARANGGATSTSKARSSGRPGSGVRSLALQRADKEKERVDTWSKKVLGQPVASFKLYRPALTFNVGVLVRHAKFGEGYVAQIFDRQKIEVMFSDGPRTLAQGLEG